MTNRSSTLPVTSAAALCWVGGFFLSLPVVQPYELARLGSLVLIALAAWMALGQGGVRLKSPMMIAMLLFWANAGLSVLWSAAPMVSFIAFCTFSALPLGFIAFSQRALPDSFFRVCAWGAGGILGGLSLWALASYFFLPDMLVNGQVRVPFADPNSYAALLMLGFFPALGVGMTAPRSGIKYLALLLAALILSAIFIINSRGVIAALIVASALFIGLGASRKMLRPVSLLTVFSAACAVAALAVWVGGDRLTPLLHMSQGVRHAESIVSGRWYIWEAAAAMIAAHAPLGTGIGTFFLYYPQFRLPQEVHSGGFMAHNDPLQFAAEMGVIAPFLFYVFLALAAVRMWKNRAGGVMTSAVFCALGAMVMHTHINFSFYIAPSLALSGLMLGWWCRATEQDDPVTVPFSSVQRVTLALPFIAALFILQGFLRSEYHADRAKEYALAGDMPRFASQVEAANDAGWGWNARPYILAATLPLGILELNEPGADRAALEKETANLLDRAEAKNPLLVSIPVYRARLALAMGRRGEAEKLYEEALRLNPLHLPSRMALADLHNDAEAFEILKAGLQWPYSIYDSIPYYSRVAQLATSFGDQEMAATALKKLEYAQQQKMERHTLPPIFTAAEGDGGS